MEIITIDGKDWMVCYSISAGYYIVVDPADPLPAPTYLVYYSP